MRHAKSDWDASYGADQERPLARRGERSAKAMGEALRTMGEVPDLIVSSTAVRAEATAELARIAGGWPCPLHLDPDLYGAGPEEVLAVAARHGGDAQRLMLVGHEPTWSLLIARLTGARTTVKTGTVAGVDLDVTRWEDAPGARGSLTFLLQPKMFIGGEDEGR